MWSRLNHRFQLSGAGLARKLSMGSRWGAATVTAVALLAPTVGMAGAHGDTAVGSRAVPRVIGLRLEIAYQMLHRRGFRVTVPTGFSARTWCQPRTRRQHPAAGSTLDKGAIVTIWPGRCLLRIPEVTPGAATVPRFVGRPASALVHWARAHAMYWSIIKAPPLQARSKPSLFSNLDIVRQWPPAGRMHQRSAAAMSTPPGLVPVPVIVWVKRLP